MDVSEAIRRQKADKDRIYALVRNPGKPRRKAITKSDVDVAVNLALDELDREFRRLAVEFPRLKQAYDTARVVVQNNRRK